METNLYIYLVAYMFFIFYTLIIYKNLTMDMGKIQEVYSYKMILLSFIGFLISNIMEIFARGKDSDFYYDLSSAGIILGFTFIGCITFSWFLYSSFKLNMVYIKDKKTLMTMSSPLILLIVICLFSLENKSVFYVKNGILVQGKYYFIPLLVYGLYVIFCLVGVLKEIENEKLVYKKKEAYSLVYFSIPPLFCGIVDLFFQNNLVLSFGFFMSIFYLFIDLQKQRIYNDALTKMNNRRLAYMYIEENLQKISEDFPLDFYILDIDYFKFINDTYGHVEGDRALVILSNAIKKSMKTLGGFSARFGGDEFILVFFDKNHEEDYVKKLLRENLKLEKESENFPHAIEISIGHYKCVDKTMTIEDVVKKADKLLYENKKERKEGVLKNGK